MADRLVGAVGRVEPVAEADQVAELGFEGGQLALPLLHVEQLGGEEVLHVSARSGAFAAQVEDRGDLDQGEAGGLSVADESERRECLVVVLAVAVGPSMRLRQQPLALVKADGGSRDPDSLGDFSDAHDLTVPLDLAPWFKV